MQKYPDKEDSTMKKTMMDNSLSMEEKYFSQR